MNPLLIAGLLLAGWALLAKKSTSATTSSTASVKVPTSTGTAAATVALPKPTTITFPTSDVDYLNDTESQMLLNDSLDDIYAEAIGSNHKIFIQAAAARLAASGDARSVELATKSATMKDAES